MPRRGFLGCLPGLLLCGAACADNPAEVLELPQVLIVGTTPLPGSGVLLNKMPANMQVYTSRQLRGQRAGNLTDFLEQNATGVTVNAAQGNPWQPDINFRGFAASPLLGTPQGVSVFFDGMRVNEPFGDAVNWDLIPQSAISSIQLIPGSNPAFGLNTLGGAIALYSKSGASEYPDHPGGSISLSGGAFGRRTLVAEGGGRSGPWDWFGTLNDAADHGWAQHNGSRVRQLFGKLGWQDDETDVDLTVGGADNRLEGTQTVPLSFPDIRQAYTWPDLNTNRAAFVAVKASRAVTSTLLLSGHLYLRRFGNHNFSSNVNDDFGPGNMVPASNDVSRIEQHSSGLGLQLAHTGVVAGLANKISVGISVDQGRARFTRYSQDATFTADRGTQALSEFAITTDADSTTRYLGAFVADSLDFAHAWTLTAAGRFNRADLRIADRTGSAPELDGTHRFTRFNLALGLNYNPSREWTAYAAFNEGMRSPTAIELTCADPSAPCKLPNNFLADPPLKPVVSRTYEVGARGSVDAQTKWSVAVFRTDLQDDLQFVSSSSGLAVNTGYFQNVGTTRRQGLEIGGTTQSGPLSMSLHYSFIDATFRSDFVANSPNNSTADANGAIAVRRGNHLPSIPRHALKLRLEFSPVAQWTVAGTLQATASIHARGDENNLDAGGRVPGWAVMNLDARYRLDHQLELFARVDNVLDRRCASIGTLGRNAFTGPSQGFDPANARAEQFRGWGTPRGASGGLQYSFE